MAELMTDDIMHGDAWAPAPVIMAVGERQPAGYERESVRRTVLGSGDRSGLRFRRQIDIDGEHSSP
jgi:hypothetical protein